MVNKLLIGTKLKLEPNVEFLL